MPVPTGKGIGGLRRQGLWPVPLLFTQLLHSPTFPERWQVLLDLCILNVFLYLRNNDPRPADNLCPISAHCGAAM